MISIKKCILYHLIVVTCIALLNVHCFAGQCKVVDSDTAGEYYGECENGFAHGYGVTKGKDTYMGQFKNGKKHGFGVYTWRSGSIYKGDWADNQMHGFGVHTWDSGAHYEGDWEKDNRHGDGGMTYNDGSRHEGSWIRHERAYNYGMNSSLHDIIDAKNARKAAVKAKEVAAKATEIAKKANILAEKERALAKEAARAAKAKLKQVQSLLLGLNYDVGTPDGIMGSKTVSAIKSYQEQKGLSIDGVVSEALIDHLTKQYDPIYDEYKNKNTIQAYDEFIEKYPYTPQKETAILAVFEKYHAKVNNLMK